jgi:hypothetical protein
MDHLISPQKQLARLLQPKGPELAGMHVGLKGRYQLTVRRAGQVIQEREFDNLILDQGLDYLGQMSLLSSSTYPNGVMGYAQIGTDGSPAAVTQTQLGAYSAGAIYSSTSSYQNSGAPNYIGTVVQFYTFVTGALVGTFREVGVGRQQTNGQLFSRALITNLAGEVDPLVLTAQDQLTIAYSLSVIPSLTRKSGTVVLEGTTYNYTVDMTFVTNVGNYAAALKMPNPSVNVPFMGVAWASGFTQGTVYGPGTPLSPTVNTDSNVPNATSAADVIATSNNIAYTYVNGSFAAKSTWQIGPTQGNLAGGIQCLVARFAFNDAANSFRCLYYFDTPVPKTNIKLLRLVFNVTWARA